MSSSLFSLTSLVRGFVMALLLLVTPAAAFAGGTPTPVADGDVNGSGLTDFSLGTTAAPVAGGDMLTGVGTTANQIANLLTGPILWIVMGAAVILAIYGFASGKMAMAFTGIGAFVLAAVLKGLFAVLKT